MGGAEFRRGHLFHCIIMAPADSMHLDDAARCCALATLLALPVALLWHRAVALAAVSLLFVTCGTIGKEEGGVGGLPTAYGQRERSAR